MTNEPNAAVLAIAEQLAAKNITPEIIAGYEMIQTAVQALLVSADRSSAPNYIEITMSGLMLPFGRAAIHLIRAGGKTPAELQRRAEDELGGVMVQLKFAKSDLEDRERANAQLRAKVVLLESKIESLLADNEANVVQP